MLQRGINYYVLNLHFISKLPARKPITCCRVKTELSAATRRHGLFR